MSLESLSTVLCRRSGPRVARAAATLAPFAIRPAVSDLVFCRSVTGAVFRSEISDLHAGPLEVTSHKQPTNTAPET
jgi:hypothetical protein